MRFHLIAIFALAAAALPAQSPPRRLITLCAEDDERFDFVGDSLRRYDDELGLTFSPAQGRVEVRRDTKLLFAFTVHDYSSNAEVLWAPGGDAFAFSYSDGGAIGNFHVRVFLVRGDAVTEASQTNSARCCRLQTPPLLPAKRQ